MINLRCRFMRIFHTYFRHMKFVVLCLVRALHHQFFLALNDFIYISLICVFSLILCCLTMWFFFKKNLWVFSKLSVSLPLNNNCILCFHTFFFEVTLPYFDYGFKYTWDIKMIMINRGEHGLVWFGLILKSYQTKNSTLKKFSRPN